MQARRLFRLALPLWIAIGGLVWLLWAQTPAPSRAQSGGILVDKQLGRASNVVYVGEYITFTIRIRNESAFTVTVLPVTDQYNIAVLAYADASVPPEGVDTAAGQLDWADLTTAFGDLAPGQEIVLVVGFIAEHPAPAVVNYAAAHDALNSEGEVVGGEDESDANESVGGNAPVTKTLTAQAGMLVTFTVEVHNHGYTTMTEVLLADVYDPLSLAFAYAAPAPDQWDFNTGVLTWTDLTLYTGDIPAHGMVTVTTVFTTIGEIGAGTVNSASVVGAGDWYGNDVTGGAGEVPITIIDRPQQPTPTPQPTPYPTPQPQPTPWPTPQPQPTPTPYPTPTPLMILLPQTGSSAGGRGGAFWLGLAALSILAGVGFCARRQSVKSCPKKTSA